MNTEINQKYFHKGCHDIRNIISTISGNYQLIEIMHSELSAEPRWLQLGNDITYLINTMNAINAYSHASDISPKICPLSEFLNSLLTDLSENPAYTSLRISANIAYATAHVLIDKDKITYVICSLLDNITEINPASSVSINAYSDVEYSYIGLSDRHDGIPPEVKARLFEPFNSTKPGHSGMSLATSYRILLAHNGNLTYSDNSHKGSTFTLMFPVS